MHSEKHIIVTMRNTYGKETIYPACIYSQIFAELLDQKTLTPRDIELIKKLGYEVRVAGLNERIL